MALRTGVICSRDLDNDSETESESEDGNFDVGSVAQTLETFAQSQLVHPENPHVLDSHLVDKAVVELLALDASSIIDHPEIHNIILRALNAITSFLDALHELQKVITNEIQTHIANGLASLLRNDLMEKLFAFRVVFHQIAASEMPQTHTAVVVCWVDVLLAKLSHAILVAMDKFCDTKVVSLGTLSQHREEMTLRAVLQFPHKWKNVPKLLQTSNVSPAALRSTIHLLFGVYVLGPRLGTNDPWTTQFSPTDSLIILRQHITNHYTQIESSYGGSDVEARIISSMILALFSEAEINQPLGSPTFRPHTQVILLALLRQVLQLQNTLSTTEVITPLPSIDLPRAVILHYSSVVPWSWSVWEDNRAIDSEIVDNLLCTWFLHVDGPSLSQERHSWEELIFTSAQSDPSGAISCFARIFRHFTTCLQSDQVLPTNSLRTLQRLCWVTTHLLRMPETSQTSHEPVIESICQSVCYTFILLGDMREAVDVKNLALEILCLAASHVIRSILLRCAEDLTLFAKLDDELTSLTRKIRNNDLSDTILVMIRQTLHFLIMAWHCRVTKLTYRQTATPFLVAIVDLLLTRPTIQSEEALIDAIITALALVETLRKESDSIDINKLWEDDDIWNLCLRHKPSNLAVASAFSLYIEACGEKRQCQVLTLLDAWDYIRDAMSLIIHHQFLEADEALSLLVLPSISSALETIFLYLEETPKEFIYASPWTLNLGELLHELTAYPQVDEYTSVLLSRLTLDLPSLPRICSTQASKEDGNSEDINNKIRPKSANLLFYAPRSSRCFLFLS